jgi:hypothetical protein
MHLRPEELAGAAAMPGVADQLAPLQRELLVLPAGLEQSAARHTPEER